jgi:lipopolysaccharide biosynthesis regulator YciM
VLSHTFGLMVITASAVCRYTRSLDAAGSMQNTFVAQVATNRAMVCLKLNKVSEAVSDANLAIAADESFAKAYLRRAQAYELQGEWQAAVRDLTKVHELDSKLPGIADKLKHAKIELKKSTRVDYYKVRMLSSGCVPNALHLLCFMA